MSDLERKVLDLIKEKKITVTSDDISDTYVLSDKGTELKDYDCSSQTSFCLVIPHELYNGIGSIDILKDGSILKLSYEEKTNIKKELDDERSKRKEFARLFKIMGE